MSPRSIRRAAERRAAKEARKLNQNGMSEEKQFVGQAPPPARDASSRPSVSSARLAANRADAQLSTGPTSETGKNTSSLNAVKTGLDDAEAHRQHLAAYEAEYRPVGLRECELVQSLADTRWRLNRIPGLEAAIYALGRTEFEGVVEEELIELHTYLKYEKSLRNLQLQESRLLRRYGKEIAELRALQRGRENRDEAELASNFRPTPTEERMSANALSDPVGFEFSNPDHAPLTCNLDFEPEALALPVRAGRLVA
jgi:hypothetical protein